jgi:Lysyl oxidase
MRLHSSLSLAGLGAALIGSAIAAVPSSATTASTGSVAAEEARPILSVTAISDHVTLAKSGRSVNLGRLGAYLIAGDDPFEVHVKRASYSDPILARWLNPNGSEVEFPADATKGFEKFRGFVHLRVRNLDGRLVTHQEHGFCPNRWSASRGRPDAPDRSPYPSWCGGFYMPWTLGSVWGLQAGWAVSAPAGSARLPVGRYVATVRIDEDFRKLLGIPNDAAYKRIKLRVVKNASDCHEHRGCRLGTEDAAERESSPSLRPAANEPAGDDQPVAGDPLPDLRALPAWRIGVHNGNVLHFAANVWNAGPSTLVIDGFRRPNEDTMDAYQYFYDENGEPTGSAKIGTMHWHAAPSHNHWHFLDFARYRLLDSDKKSVVLSRKQSFCLANTDAIDYTVPGANWNPDGTDLSTACGGHSALSVREVLDTGSGDTYEQWRAGQAFVLKNVPNGTYFIEVTANPFSNLHEPDETNNVAYRKIFIGGTRGNRTVRVAPVGMIGR